MVSFLPSNLKYAANAKLPDRNPESPQMPFSPDELDDIDDTIEQILIDSQSVKTSMKSQITSAYESIKKRFMGILDRVFEDIYEVGEHHSEYAKFELLCRDFQDKKSEFETDFSPETQSALCRSVVNLLCFDKAKQLYEFATPKSIQEILDQSAASFEEFYVDLETGQFSSFFRDLETKLNSIRVLDGDFLKHYTAEPGIKASGKHETDDSAHENTACFMKGLDKFRLKLMADECGEGPESEKGAVMSDQSLKDSLLQFSMNKSSRRRKDYFSCYLLNKQSHVMLIESEGFDRMCNTKELFTVDARSPNLDCKPLLELQSNVENLSVSPCDRFIGVSTDASEMFQLYRLSSLESPKAHRIFYTDRFKISKFVFVDSVEGAKLVFADVSGRLGVIDLEAFALDFMMGDLARVNSLFYVDRSSVLLLTNQNEFGILCLNTLSITGFARFTLEREYYRGYSRRNGESPKIFSH